MNRCTQQLNLATCIVGGLKETHTKTGRETVHVAWNGIHLQSCNSIHFAPSPSRTFIQMDFNFILFLKVNSIRPLVLVYNLCLNRVSHWHLMTNSFAVQRCSREKRKEKEREHKSIAQQAYNTCDREKKMKVRSSSELCHDKNGNCNHPEDEGERESQ